MNIILHNEHLPKKFKESTSETWRKISHCQGRNQAIASQKHVQLLGTSSVIMFPPSENISWLRPLVPAHEYAFNAQENTAVIEWKSSTNAETVQAP